MFDRAELWTDVGYEILDGTLEDDKSVTLGRTKEASPEFPSKGPARSRTLSFSVALIMPTTKLNRVAEQ